MTAMAVADPGLCCAEWAELPAGPELGIRLAVVDMAALPGDELVEVMVAARRQTAWMQSVELAAVAELSRRRHAEEHLGQVRWTSSTHERLVDEVAMELTVPSGAARELVWLAETLPQRHSATWAALVAGQIDYRRAKVVTEALHGLEDEPARRVEAKVLPAAPQLTVTKLRARLKRAVRAADPAAAERRRKAAHRERRLEVWENVSGTCDLVGRDLAAEEVKAIWNRLSAVAQAMRAGGDQRPLDAVRADLFRDLLRGVPLPEAARRVQDSARCPGGSPPDDGPAGPGGEQGQAVNGADVLAAVERQIAEALAGSLDERLQRLLAQTRENGRLDGFALLVAEAVEAMDDALEDLRDRWCESTGQHAHEGHRPPAAMRRRILGRHETCVFPSCHSSSAACDLDHTRPYDPGGPDGGTTRPDNLAPLCRRHHRTKQHPRWRLIQIFPGLLVWITPAGRWHLVLPSPRE